MELKKYDMQYIHLQGRGGCGWSMVAVDSWLRLVRGCGWFVVAVGSWLRFVGGYG